MINLETDIIKISRVGEATAKKLKKIGINTVYDLLFYFPYKYEDYRLVMPMDKLKPEMSANVVGQIELIQNKRSYKKRMYITEALISDETDQIKVIWFNQPFIAKNLRVGDTVSLAGKVKDDHGGAVMLSPIYEKIISGKSVHTQGLVPIYHLTSNLTQKQIRFLIKQVINLSDRLTEWLPKEIIKNQRLLSLSVAIKKIHFSNNFQDIENARTHFAFKELFLIQLQSQIIRKDALQCVSTQINFFEIETKKFVDSLPFQLTDAQRKTSWEIIKDIGEAKPMARLLEGDVGSGKTVVAIIALLNTALNKLQSVLMVPTEILALQHFELITKLLANFKLNIAILTRSKQMLAGSNKSKKEIKEMIKSGEIDIIIGTHTLIQESVGFKNLGLVIIDEQHRFGVEQRKNILSKSGNKLTLPHLLSMTATPIPRSLALALFGDLDISVINQMPRGRKKIITKVVEEQNRKKAYSFMQNQIKVGRQVFVICPLIDISDKLGVKSIKEEYKKLNENIFPDIEIGMLHGKMKPKEKEEVMNNFLNKKTKILVSTSVVEVGVDVPNASIMMIEGADRFGLAQLHQFRGRVGRGEHQSYCLLFTESELPRTLERLETLSRYNDGFTLAKMDLKYRGPGEVYGIAQKGFPELKVATLFDYELMKKAKKEAEIIIKKDPNLSGHFILKNKMQEKNKLVHPE